MCLCFFLNCLFKIDFNLFSVHVQMSMWAAEPLSKIDLPIYIFLSRIDLFFVFVFVVVELSFEYKSAYHFCKLSI